MPKYPQFQHSVYNSSVSQCVVYRNYELYVLFSSIRLFVTSPRVRSWVPLVPVAALCSEQCLLLLQEEWLKPRPSTSCWPTAVWPNLPAACPAWRTSPIRPLVCLALPKRGGHVEWPGFIHPLFWKQPIRQDDCRPGKAAAVEDISDDVHA